MLRSVRSSAVILVFAAVGLVTTTRAQGPTFKSGTQIVPVYVTVLDADKRLVPDLVQDDFEILDNGKPAPIILFDAEVQPISVVVMLDTSASMTGSLDLLKDASEQFLIRLLPQDRGMVGAFNDKIQFVSQFTSDRDDLVGSLRDIGFGNPTRLYDAIDASLEQLRPIEGRRVVLIFTDGEDTYSKVGSGRVLERARGEEVMIYSIGLESVYFNGQQKVRSRPDRVIKRLAEETGGGYFELKKTDDLGPTFTRVAQELHSQYSLGFAPIADGKVHRLQVTVKNKAGMTARARRSYQAPAGTAAKPS
jgi:Ca-activated chloride channel family protein